MSSPATRYHSQKAQLSDTDLGTESQKSIFDKPFHIPDLVAPEDLKTKLVCYDNIPVFKLPPKGQHFRSTPPCKGVRRPPNLKMFYGCGPLGPTGGKMTFKDKLRGKYDHIILNILQASCKHHILSQALYSISHVSSSRCRSDTYIA